MNEVDDLTAHFLKNPETREAELRKNRPERDESAPSVEEREESTELLRNPAELQQIEDEM